MSLHSDKFILILSQPVFALIPEKCVLSAEAANIYFMVLGLTRPGLKTYVYHTQVVCQSLSESDQLSFIYICIPIGDQTRTVSDLTEWYPPLAV